MHAWARVSLDTLYRGHTAKVAGSEADIIWQFWSTMHWGCPSKPSKTKVTWAL